jgi:hypothetical protein
MTPGLAIIYLIQAALLWDKSHPEQIIMVYDKLVKSEALGGLAPHYCRQRMQFTSAENKHEWRLFRGGIFRCRHNLLTIREHWQIRVEMPGTRIWPSRDEENDRKWRRAPKLEAIRVTRQGMIRRDWRRKRSTGGTTCMTLSRIGSEVGFDRFRASTDPEEEGLLKKAKILVCKRVSMGLCLINYSSYRTDLNFTLY